MDRTEYSRWWQENTDDGGEIVATLPEPAATLAAHVMALWERLDRLTDPDSHDKTHGKACRCFAAQCACAYDHPDAVCMVHEGIA